MIRRAMGAFGRALPWRKREQEPEPTREQRARRIVVRQALRSSRPDLQHRHGPVRTRRQVRGRAAAMRGRKANVARLRKERT